MARGGRPASADWGSRFSCSLKSDLGTWIVVSPCARTATIQITRTFDNLDVAGFNFMRNYVLAIPNWPNVPRCSQSFAFSPGALWFSCIYIIDDWWHTVFPWPRVSLKTGWSREKHLQLLRALARTKSFLYCQQSMPITSVLVGGDFITLRFSGVSSETGETSQSQLSKTDAEIKHLWFSLRVSSGKERVVEENIKFERTLKS